MTDPYRIRSAETWAMARDAYLGGEAAESVCGRFHLGLRAFRARASEEGWHRADQPDPDPLALTEEDEANAGEIDDQALRSLARTRMALAARRGLVGEALRWARFAEAVTRQAEADRRAERDRADADARAGRSAARQADIQMRNLTANARAIGVQARAVLATEQARAALHDLHDVHPGSDSPDTEPAPVNRADRRRLKRQAPKRR